MYWSKAYTDTALSNHTYWEDARMDHKGQSNTSVIVAAHPDENSSNNAAIYCNEYSTAGTSAGDWYLPAAGELLTNVSENYDEIIPAITALGWSWENLYLWSSSEYGRDIVWLINSHEFAMTHGGKNSSRSVVCFLEVSNSL